MYTFGHIIGAKAKFEGDKGMSTIEQYSNAFNKIKPEVLGATRWLIEQGIWDKNLTNLDKTIIMGQWVQRCASLYEIPKPIFYYKYRGKDVETKYRQTGGGIYYEDSNTIYLYKKPSLVTLIHEFRHALQCKLNPKPKLWGGSRETDARAWSLSIYKTVAPKSFERAARNGMLYV